MLVLAISKAEVLSRRIGVMLKPNAAPVKAGVDLDRAAQSCPKNVGGAGLYGGANAGASRLKTSSQRPRADLVRCIMGSPVWMRGAGIACSYGRIRQALGTACTLSMCFPAWGTVSGITLGVWQTRELLEELRSCIACRECSGRTAYLRRRSTYRRS